jgi:hypothetical protein
MITATAYVSKTLNAPVELLSDLDTPGRVRVRTLAGGVGGWSTPGRELFVDRAILHEITDSEAAATAPVEPAQVMPIEPLTAPIDAEDYMQLLLKRQAAWEAAHPHYRLRPLLEWFIEPGDERWVHLPAPAPKRKPAPRVYRSAASIRTELAAVEAQMARIANSGPDDPAAVNISPFARSRAARTAGRRRFAKLDRDLERYTALERRRSRLAGRLASAEAREAKQADRG